MQRYFIVVGALLCFINIACAIDHYAIAYNYFDEMAQNYCAAKSDGWVFSLRRDCAGVGPTCNDIWLRASMALPLTNTTINCELTQPRIYSQTQDRLVSPPMVMVLADVPGHQITVDQATAVAKRFD
ncbi:uncharacterized protein LOC127879949 [Dreissena polymorpha]|uniref:uncharacterized protein LOC127879949 n=1 Tax=Dreissena polymorpha TaxID=45954 RepID=UPI002264E139|nr:uncharacterized protein LOC127879949 [Dreissena polymorpha]